MKFNQAAFFLVALLPASAHAQGRNAEPLPLARIRPVIQAHRRAINACYQSARRVRPDTPPHIDFAFVVRLDGRVTDVNFPITASNAPLGFCIGRLIRTWQFPLPNGGYTVTVDYPFDF